MIEQKHGVEGYHPGFGGYHPGFDGYHPGFEGYHPGFEGYHPISWDDRPFYHPGLVGQPG